MDAASYGGWIDDYIQDPTTATLATLASSGYITVSPDVNDLERTYAVSLTPSGVSLLRLDRRFEHTRFAAPHYGLTHSRAAVRKVLAKTFSMALRANEGDDDHDA